ncbi:MAG: hypothetical protein RJA25_423 [Bacteroidota bacterium]|jgi:hypothetical protein
MIRTIPQNKQLHTLLSKLKIDSNIKGLLVYQYTNERTANSSEMDVYECQNLINHLRSMLNQGYVQIPNSDYSKDEQHLDKKRKRLIAKFREMGYSTEDNRADMQRISETVFKYWRKGLNQLNEAELSKIIAVVEHKWIPNFYNKQ